MIAVTFEVFLLLFTGALGGFQRIDLLRFFDNQFHMGCARAVAPKPLAFRIRINFTVLSCFVLENLIAPFAFLNNGLATAADESAAFFAHESAIHALFDRFTQHCIDPPYMDTSKISFQMTKRIEPDRRLEP